MSVSSAFSIADDGIELLLRGVELLAAVDDNAAGEDCERRVSLGLKRKDLDRL